VDLGVLDRVYLVTGGSGGLGYATAKQLVAEGARVVISGRTSSGTTRSAKTLGGVDRAIGVAGDNSELRCPGWRYRTACAPGSAWWRKRCPMNSARAESVSTDSCPHGLPPRVPWS
jgi:NAD(P)-dependent dehydrogenase (short-subunit alcohol dehydrogenase family)